MIYLILLFTTLFFILAWRRLDWAVMFLIAALPAYLIRFSFFGLPSTMLEVMILIVCLVWAVKNFSQVKNNFLENFKKENKKVKIRYPFDWEIILLLLVALAAVVVSGFNPSALGIWKAYFFEPALFFIVILNVMKGEKGREKILWSLAASALIVSALAIYQKITGAFIDNSVWAAAGTRRVVSFFGYPNAVGLYLGPIVLVMAGWLASVIARGAFCPPFKGGLRGLKNLVNLTSLTLLWKEGNNSVAHNEKVKTIFIGLTIIVSMFSIYFAKSKGALLGIAVGLVVFGLLANKKIRWAAIITLIIISAGVAAYRPARNLAVENITLISLSGQIRKAGWSDTWRMLKNGHLITGAGLANYQAAVAPYHTEGIFIKDPRDPEAQKKLVFNEPYRTAHWQPLEIYLYPHNLVLNFWSELGLAGLLLFIWIILKYFWLGTRVLSLRGGAKAMTKQSHMTVIPGLTRDPGDDDKDISTANPWITACAGMTREKNPLAMTDRYIVIGLICAMIAIIIHGLVDVPYFKNDLAVMFWILVAMVSLINLENKYGKNNL